MRPLSLVLLLGIVILLVVSRDVGAQSPAPAPGPESAPVSGGLGHNATSLCAELIIPNNYTCIEYNVTTDDGFILGIQHMPSPRGLGRNASGGPPVLLQHGLTAGGDNWVINTPEESLAFILADAGFDVWITNSRNIQWSHGHRNLTPSENAYWAWTYDELATYDLKASTEFVYNSTGGRNMSYIGHSLGTTILFAGLTQGRFNTTILGYLNAAVMLAPIAYSANLTAPLLRLSLLNYSSPEIYTAGAMEYSTYVLVQEICGFPLINPLLCYLGLIASVGLNSYIDISRLEFYTQYFPQPTSTYNFNHLAQGLVRKNFAFYDKGTTDNLATYGQVTAPNYDLTKFPETLPIQYWTGGLDQVADPIDTANILSQVPSLNRQVYTLPNYGHLDFVLSYNAFIDIYPSIVAFLKNHTST